MLFNYFVSYNYDMTKFNSLIIESCNDKIDVNDIIYHSSLTIDIIDEVVQYYSYNNVEPNGETLFRYLMYLEEDKHICNSNLLVENYYVVRINNHFTFSLINEYKSIDGLKNLPYFGPPISIYSMDTYYKVAIIIIFVICTLVNCGFLVFVILKRHSRIIKKSFLLFTVLVILLSILINASAFEFVKQSKTDFMCNLRLMILIMSIKALVDVLFMKTWRVHKVLNNTGMKKVHITNCDLIKAIICLIFIQCLFMVLWGLVSPGKYIILFYYRAVSSILVEETDIDHITIIYDCKINTVFGAIEILMDVILLSFVLYVSFRVRNADKEYNESITITYSIMIINIFF